MLNLSRQRARARLLELRSNNPSTVVPPDLGIHDGLIIDKDNWVRMWVDNCQMVQTHCGTISAYRGVSFDGRDLWLVRHLDKTQGYHSQARDVGEAIREAEIAWAERKRVRRRWPEVEMLASELLAGRRKLNIVIQDAYESALCEIGVRSFMRRIGLGRVERLPGRIVALLMKIEPQVGFVIFRAWEREQGLPPAIPAQAETRSSESSRRTAHDAIGLAH